MELKRYKGSLTVEQLIIAHKKTKSNATSLYKEAQLLFENKMYARCYFLLCIANEELGKSMFVSSDDNLTPWKELEQRIPTLEELKMASLYSDMFQNDFFDPEEIITFNLAKSTLELTGHRIEFINTISPPDNILRLAKKEDILAYRTKLKEMGMEIDF